MNLLRDIRFALRKLAKSPGFTSVAVLLLALGIGVNTVIFTVIKGVILTPLPYEDPDELVFVWEMNVSRGRDFASTSESNYLDFRDRSSTFSELAAIGWQNLILTGFDAPVQLEAMRATHNVMPALRIRPVLGRNFLPEEDRPGRERRVIILSNDLWRTRFGASPGVIDSTLTLDGIGYTVVGVLPRRQDFTSQWDAWIPVVPDPSYPRGDHRINMLGRLGEGVTVEQARADLGAIAERLGLEFPDSNEGWGVRIESFYDTLIEGDFRSGLWMLMGAVAFVLLIACVNLSSLLLARTLGRRREIAITMAFGADRRQAIRPVMIESIVIAMAGGVLGVLLALWGVGLLVGLEPPGLPRLEEIAINGWVLLFTLSVTVLAGILPALIPAFQSTGADPFAILREGGRQQTYGPRGNWLRQGLVVTEMALSVVLLAGAGLLIRSFVRLQQVDPGFQIDNRVVVGLSLPQTQYTGPQEVKTFFTRLIYRLEASPGVRSAAAVLGGLALVDGLNAKMEIDPGDRAREEGEQGLSADWRMVTPGYFETMGIPMHSGRDFNDSDDYSTRLVCVLSENLAELLWPGEDPVGRTALLWADPDRAATVIGVVEGQNERSLDGDRRLAVYMPLYIAPPIFETPLVIHTDGDLPVASLVQSAVTDIDPLLPTYDIRTMEELARNNTASRRFIMLILVMFAGIALFLAAAGIAGVMAYMVNRRTSEIGIRIAVGASSVGILGMIIGQSVKLVLAGVFSGTIIALGLSRLIASQLYGTAPTDPMTYVGVTLVLLLTTLVSVLAPALRASRVDPVKALNAE